MRALTPMDYVALTIYGEARGEPIEGKIAVANVLRNRRRSGRWGTSYASVCLAPLQFSCWTPKGGAENYATLSELADRLGYAGTPDDPVVRECYGVAAGLEAWIRDNVAGATHYHVATMRTVPKWAAGRDPVARIGDHLFYAGIA